MQSYFLYSLFYTTRSVSTSPVKELGTAFSFFFSPLLALSFVSSTEFCVIDRVLFDRPSFVSSTEFCAIVRVLFDFNFIWHEIISYFKIF